MLSGMSVRRSQQAGSSSPVVSVAPTSAFCSNDTIVNVGIRVNRDGTIDVQDNCSGYAYDQDWVTSGLPDATIGDDYEVRLTVNTTAPTSGPTTGAWHTISSTRTWAWSSAATFDSGDWTIEIREIADTGNTDQADFEWDVEDGS